MKEDVLISKHAPQVYVWIYDPVHFKTFAMGLILGELFDSRTVECFILLLLADGLLFSGSYRGDRGHAFPAVAGRNARGGLLPERGGGLLCGQHSAPRRW